MKKTATITSLLIVALIVLSGCSEQPKNQSNNLKSLPGI